MANYEFESERLGFRHWNDTDKKPFGVMNSDADVMNYFPNMLSEEESNQFIVKIEKHFCEYGFGLWAVELKTTKEFIGFIGFYTANFESDFTPCTEIGWRLHKSFWNKGYATEGAKACLEYGFVNLGLQEVYSFTSVINNPSINVMEKIGMKKERVFSHPRIANEHPLCPHVLYKVTNS